MSDSASAALPPQGALNPLLQQTYASYQGMTPEQLQELVLKYKGTAQGQLAQRLLQQKRLLSAQDVAQNPTPPEAPQPTTMGGFAQGGDVPDFSERFNTPLSAEQEAAYQAWGHQQETGHGRNPAADVRDYDMRGLWKSGSGFAANGHGGDAWKKPNHPTFSDQSHYSGGDNGVGGSWTGGKGGQPWTFHPSATNLNMYGADGLRDYYRRAEPNNQLDLPEARGEGGPAGPPQSYALGGFLKPGGGAVMPERGIGVSGLLHTAGPGRMDNLNIHPQADSYVVPADVVSGLGQGNSLAGAKAMEMALHTGPFGAPLPAAQHHSTMPGRGFHAAPASRGFSASRADGGETQRVPIVAAGGEYIISPDQVQAIGHGDIKRGQDILDKFVLHVRARTIKEMKKLKGPVKS